MRVLLFLALIYPAMASALTGNELLSDCSEDMGSRGISSCLSYLEAVTDAHKTFVGWEMLKEPSQCIPGRVTLGQAQAVVIKALKEHPEDLHNSASSLVLNALYDAFPPDVKFENGEPVYYCP